MKNYYQILNINPNATEEDIKRSYRVLAKRYHPDVNPGDASAADKFADINEANAVLSDPKSRAEYDAKLREAQAPHPNPEDVIARQRAQAQAAARAAARRAAYQSAGTQSVHDATMARARAAAQAAAAMRNAQAQAQAAAQAQAQAQIQSLCNQAHQKGYEQGFAEAQAVAVEELDKATATVRNLQAENQKLQAKLDEVNNVRQKLKDTENDRRELEQELFNRDRELSQERIRANEMEEQLRELRIQAEHNKVSKGKIAAETEGLREMLDKAQACIKKLEEDKKKLEQDRYQAVLNNQAQIQLQQDKRRQMQEEMDELTKKLAAVTAEADILRAENEQWQQYARSEDFLSDTERRIEDWRKKTQADRRLAKPTLYGVLGVLIWATTIEIEDAHFKLYKRYFGKSDSTVMAKLAKVEEAYAVLSDEQKRAEYNESIGITPERIEEERKLIADNESLMEEYRSRLASKEFWAKYDETMSAALGGDANAQNSVGEMLYYGDEIDQDLEQAVFWFKEAAKQQHAEAMYNLGVCFINGEGTEKNEATGSGFIRQAAKLGSKAAMARVKLMKK